MFIQTSPFPHVGCPHQARVHVVDVESGTLLLPLLVDASARLPDITRTLQVRGQRAGWGRVKTKQPPGLAGTGCLSKGGGQMDARGRTLTIAAVMLSVPLSSLSTAAAPKPPDYSLVL
jgi:hypothetical protein